MQIFGRRGRRPIVTVGVIKLDRSHFCMESRRRQYFFISATKHACDGRNFDSQDRPSSTARGKKT